jgi:hypothetical protein
MTNTQERWESFSTQEQLGAIGAELMRAGHWQNGSDGSRENFLTAIGRGLELVDLTLGDKRWRGLYLTMLLGLRDELAKLYCGMATYDAGLLYRAL